MVYQPHQRQEPLVGHPCVRYSSFPVYHFDFP